MSFVTVSELLKDPTKPDEVRFYVSFSLDSFHKQSMSIVAHSLTEGLVAYAKKNFGPELTETILKENKIEIEKEVTKRIVDHLWPEVLKRIDPEVIYRIATLAAGKAIGQELK